MTTVKPNTNAAALKAEREHDRAQAMREYEADRDAWQANMMRLRALRLARESADAQATAARQPIAKNAPRRRASPARTHGVRRAAS